MQHVSSTAAFTRIGSGAEVRLSEEPCLGPITGVEERDVVDAYHFLLARWLVLRQQMLDLGSGVRWNEIVRRPALPPGMGNPNPDLVASDAWISLSERSCVVLELPPIRDRYYNVQLLNGWGETVANINERTYPEHPSGRFALCLAGAPLTDVSDEIVRIDLPCTQLRMKIVVQVAGRLEEARDLERRIVLHARGRSAAVAELNAADLRFSRLLNADCFDSAEAILGIEHEPGKEAAKSRALLIAAAAADPQKKREITKIIQKTAVPLLFELTHSLGTMGNGWTRSNTIDAQAGDYLLQAAMNLTEIWANGPEEILTFSQSGLDGSSVCRQLFPPRDNPAFTARHGWSVTCVGEERMRPFSNAGGRYGLSSHSPPELNADGSLELWFAPERPKGCPDPNWLPTPPGRRYKLVYRFYCPLQDALEGTYFPPPLL